MILIEMMLAGENATGSVMISMDKISEVDELGNGSVRLSMVSGNAYVVAGESFAAAVNSIEGISYMKMKTPEQIAQEQAEAEELAAKAAAEEPKEVEGELVD
ncbi:MAG: hypothetical protein ACRC6V_04460 [Bacteroidales bacterium]